MSWATRPPGQESGGYKLDTGKPRMDLLPPSILTGVARTFTYGAAKYAESPEAYMNNWLKGMRFGQMYAALQRHLTAFWSGEDIDEESGLPHMFLACACSMMLAEYATNPLYAEFDDRPTAERVEKGMLCTKATSPTTSSRGLNLPKPWPTNSTGA